MTRLLLLFVLLSSQVFGQGGLGSVVLPGNITCDTMYISVTGCGGFTTLTYNGYTYDLVEIGGQCWFAENLQTTKYSDGSPIDYPGTNNTTWENNTTGAYAWYDNDSSTYASTYGPLYNWYAVDNAAGLCPTGWHVATDCEWMYLEDTLGMSTADQEDTGLRGTDEGGKLKETGTTHWLSPNTGATNSSGFTGLPGGYRSFNGNFNTIGYYGYWWSSTEDSTSSDGFRILYYSNGTVGRNYYGKDYGFSVRCIKGSIFCTDTTFVQDTTFVTDTTEVFDTTYVTVTDTNWVNDTTFVTDTTEVFDTTYVTVNDTNTVNDTITYYDTVLVSVTDTLIIDVTLTGVSPPNNTNTLKVYPNPAKDQLYIDNGDYLSMSGYTLKIVNSVGQDVFSSLITTPLFVIDISTLGSTGLYFIQVIDGSSNVLENKKLVLE